jgi:hypothetical protein
LTALGSRAGIAKMCQFREGLLLLGCFKDVTRT